MLHAIRAQEEKTKPLFSQTENLTTIKDITGLQTRNNVFLILEALLLHAARHTSQVDPKNSTVYFALEVPLKQDISKNAQLYISTNSPSSFTAKDQDETRIISGKIPYAMLFDDTLANETFYQYFMKYFNF